MLFFLGIGWDWLSREVLLRLKNFGEDSSSVSQADKKKRFFRVVVGATTREGFDATDI
jgi:hypothetical protein